MIYFISIQQALAKLLRDEIFSTLFNTSLDLQCKAYCILSNIKIDKDLLNNNFLELQKEGFFYDESEEIKFKNLPEETQVFYYLEFKKYKR